MRKDSIYLESRIQSTEGRVFICMGAFLVYALIFLPLYPIFSRATIGLVTLPILISASLLGFRGGIIAGLISIPVNTSLFFLAGERSITSFSIENLMIAHFVLITIGFITGYLFDSRMNLEKAFSIREQSTASLQESEPYYRLIMAQAPDGIVLYDLETKQVLETNRTCQQMLGYTAKEIRQLSIYDIVMHDRKVLKSLLQHNRNKNMVWVNECQHKHKDGSLIDTEVSSRLITINGKEILSTVVRDITQRKQAESELAASKEKYQLVVESTMEVVLTVNKMGTILFCNKQLEKTYGYAVSEVIGKSFTNYAPISEWPKFLMKLKELFQNKEILRFETIVYHKDGRIIPVEMSGRLAQQEGKLIVISVVKDISERVQAERKFRNIIENSQDGIMLIDEQGMILEWNRGLEEITGVKRADMLGTPIWDTHLILGMDERSKPDRREKMKAAMLNSLQTGQLPWMNNLIEQEIQHKNKKTVILQMKMSPIQTTKGFMISCLARDITERKQMEQELQHAATHDSLTGLANRALFNDLLKHDLSKAKRDNKQMAVFFIDLDNFKTVNDTYGHPIGDQLLIAFTQRLQDLFRESDTIARLAGDEFVLLLNDLAETEDTAKIATKMLSVCAKPYKLENILVSQTLSIGISIYPDDAADAATLLQKADTAMYQAKRQGKNRYRFSNSLTTTPTQT